MKSGGEKSQSVQEDNGDNPWDSLAENGQVEPVPEPESVPGPEVAPESVLKPEVLPDSPEEQGESFMDSELKRIAKATGRVPDDEGVIKLNLALRYEKFHQYQEMYDEAKKTHTMIQQATLEDMATAKRELEEAIYLYDKRFNAIDEKQRRRELKEAYRRSQDLATKKQNGEEGYYLRIQNERNRRAEGMEARREEFGLRRSDNAEALASKLPGIVSEIKNTEIFKTYELNKDGEPSIKERRAGFEGVGKDGFYNEDHEIDWQLYPHAPEVVKNDSQAQSEKADNKPEGTVNLNDLSPDEMKALGERLIAQANVYAQEASKSDELADEYNGQDERQALEDEDRAGFEQGEYDYDEGWDANEVDYGDEEYDEREMRKNEILHRLAEIGSKLKNIFLARNQILARMDEIDEELETMHDIEPVEVSQTERDNEEPVEAPQAEQVDEGLAEAPRVEQIDEIQQQKAAVQKRLAEIDAELAKLGGAEPEVDVTELPIDNQYSEMIRAQFKDIAGEDGIEYMTSTKPLDKDTSIKMEEWWDGLSEEARDEIVEYKKQTKGSGVGRALAEWLKARELID